MSAATQKGYTPAPPQKDAGGSAYDPATLPAREDGGSRFSIPVTAAGWPTSAAENVARVYGEFLGDRIGSVPSLTPEPLTVNLMWADAEGVHPRGAVTRVPERENVRPSKLGKCQLKGGALLDSLFMGEEAWEKATDRECFQALADLAYRSGLTGGPLCKLNDLVARALLARAGIPVPALDVLPHPGGR